MGPGRDRRPGQRTPIRRCAAEALPRDSPNQETHQEGTTGLTRVCSPPGPMRRLWAIHPQPALALPAIQVPVADRNFKAASMRERTCSL